MKLKNYLYITAACLILLGCGSTRNIPPTAIVTWTPLPTKTARPTLTATPTATLIPLPAETQTPLPTLEPEQAEEAIRELLWNSSDCPAPCFMGIIPSQTTLSEVNNLFLHLGRELHHTNREGDKEFYEVTYRFDSGLAIYIEIAAQSGIVTSLNIPIVLPQDQSSSTRREWLTYSPDTLINQYGSPSKVNFFVGRGPTPSYAMDMYFDSNDLIVEYYSYDLGAKLQVCPLLDQIESIRIWIGKEPQNPPLEGIPLEQAASMTMEEFANVMTGNPDGACFNLKEEKFP